MKVVLTHHRRFRKAALAEAAELLGELQAIEQPDHSVTIVEADDGDVDRLRSAAFVQHVAPADTRVWIDGTEADVARLRESIGPLGVGIRGRFAVQCRRGAHSGGASHADAAYSTRDIEIVLGQSIEQAGATVDLDTPEQVVSVYLGAATAYGGVSPATGNKRPLIPQHRRYTATPDICRAEHKLHEAIEVWDLAADLGSADVLDVGASPGGWSWVLAGHGARVTAVDPGDLDARVEGHPLVAHVKAKGEGLEFPSDFFDWVVNDMNVDPPLAAEVLLRARGWLRRGGRSVSTLKLAGRSRPREVLADFVSLLAPGYELEAAQHFYSNRQEVTLLLRRI